MNLPRKRLGYDACISSSISQVEYTEKDPTILSPWEYFFPEVVSLVNLKFLLTSFQMTDFLSLGWNQTLECGWDQVQIFLAGIHGKYCEC